MSEAMNLRPLVLAAEISAINIRVAAMQAANSQREHIGNSEAYGESEFWRAEEDMQAIVNELKEMSNDQTED
jgi:glucokinase